MVSNIGALGTIGEAVIANPSRNVIPGEIAFTMDLRSADAGKLDAIEKGVRDAIKEIAAHRKVDVAFDKVWHKPPTHFNKDFVNAVETAATSLGYSHRRITSGAGHDACNLNNIMPTAMVFIPSKDGISHNEPRKLDAGRLRRRRQCIDAYGAGACRRRIEVTKTDRG